jgi:Rad3-related DNA helicase|tara:strand:+ start:1189 stop:1593 length:405 start_codon:yes stop_codon:yes gene_type:complete
MNKIVRDIEEIVRLSQAVHTHLQKGKINKAKRELRQIIKFDIDELRRIQKEHGDKRLLEECVIVLNQAKRTLRDLNSFELLDEAKELNDKIIEIERHGYDKTSEGLSPYFLNFSASCSEIFSGVLSFPYLRKSP